MTTCDGEVFSDWAVVLYLQIIVSVMQMLKRNDKVAVFGMLGVFYVVQIWFRTFPPRLEPRSFTGFYEYRGKS